MAGLLMGENKINNQDVLEKSLKLKRKSKYFVQTNIPLLVEKFSLLG